MRDNWLFLNYVLCDSALFVCIPADRNKTILYGEYEQILLYINKNNIA
jgi:hypothetical protein